MNRQKREEAIRSGLLPDKKRHEQRPEEPQQQEQIRGGDTADQPNRGPKPERIPPADHTRS